MDDRSIVFLEVMIAIGVIGVVTFLIYLVSRRVRPQETGTPDEQGAATPAPQWYGFLLAAIVLTVAVLLLIWQLLPSRSAGGWEADPRSMTFIIVMLAIAGAGLVVFLVFVFWRATRQGREVGQIAAGAKPPPIAADAGGEVVAQYNIPSATRLLGLLSIAVALVILNWAYVPHAAQYAMMAHLIYPAGLVVALVMLFDKATRAWSVKGPGESLREWLFCDALVFLLVLGYLNLVQSGAGETYASMFWDFLHIVAFLLVFWLLDRKTTRYRFLITYAYLIGLPILLLIWRTVQGIEAPADISWWSTIWPFFFLSIVFFVLEIIALIVTRATSAQDVATTKDVLFLILYGIFLIAAIPEAAT